LSVTVSNPSAILDDAAAKTAFENAMASELAVAAGFGVRAQDVKVAVSAAGSSRRLQSGGLSVSYTITMPNVQFTRQATSQLAEQTDTQLLTHVTTALTTAQETVPALASLSATGATHAKAPVQSTPGQASPTTGSTTEKTSIVATASQKAASTTVTTSIVATGGSSSTSRVIEMAADCAGIRWPLTAACSAAVILTICGLE